MSDFSKRLPLVPVVMGPSDYWKIAPPHSYIDVNDFATVEELANYLLYLGKMFKPLLVIFERKFRQIEFLDVHEEEYLSYFEWKDEYLLYDDHAYCQLCRKLNDPDEPEKVYSDLRNWFLFDQNHFPYCTNGMDRKYINSFTD